MEKIKKIVGAVFEKTCWLTIIITNSRDFIGPGEYSPVQQKQSGLRMITMSNAKIHAPGLLSWNYIGIRNEAYFTINRNYMKIVIMNVIAQLIIC